MKPEIPISGSNQGFNIENKQMLLEEIKENINSSSVNIELSHFNSKLMNIWINFLYLVAYVNYIYN